MTETRLICRRRWRSGNVGTGSAFAQKPTDSAATYQRESKACDEAWIAAGENSADAWRYKADRAKCAIE